MDKTLYQTRPDVISICRSVDLEDKRKFLLFRDPKHEENFIKTNAFKEDNYKVVHNEGGIILLDKVILPLQGMKKAKIKYELLNQALAESKAETVISRHKR